MATGAALQTCMHVYVALLHVNPLGLCDNTETHSGVMPGLLIIQTISPSFDSFSNKEFA